MHIDGWTLLLQAINLLVLLALLHRLFFKPLLRVIDARRAAVQAEMDRADTARREAEQRAQALADQQAAAGQAREALLQAARQEAQAERDAARARARQEADAALEAARRQAAQERREAVATLLDEAGGLATALAARLLAQAGTGDAGFLDALLSRLQATPEAERAAWFAEAAPRRATLVSAHALDDGLRDRAEHALRAALGEGLQLNLAVDAALIAGVELRLPHGVLALHWAGELAAARVQMQQAALEGASP
jgi:F-type H+-transporting ATPase subunit b